MASNRSLGSLTLDLIAKIGGFTTGMDQAARVADKDLTDIEKRAYEFGEKIGDIFKTAAAAIGIGFTLDKFVDSVKESINEMDELSKAAQRVGTSTEAFSGLNYAAKLADVSLEDLQGTLGKLIKTQGAALDPNSKQAKIFDALGISVKNADGTLRDSIDVFKDFATQFKDLKGSPEIIAAGFDIFGKSFQGVIPLLKDGAEGINEATEEAAQLNQVIGQDTGEAAEAFNDNLTRLQLATKGVFNEIAANLLPVLEDYTNELVDNAKEGNKVADVGDDITQVLESLTVVVKAAAIFWDTLKVAIQETVTVATGAVDSLQAVGKAIAHTISFGKIGPSYKEIFSGLSDAGSATATGLTENFDNFANSVVDNVDSIKKILGGDLLKGVFPTRKAKGQADDFIDSIYGSDADAEAALKKKRDRLQGILGNSDANNEKAKKQAEALADAYDKLNEAVQKTADSADPVNKAYNDYATTVRNISKLGGDVIEKGGDVERVQQSVATAVSAAQKKLADDLAAPMKAATAYNEALKEQLDATQDLIDAKVSAVGMGTKEAANQQELANVYREGAKAIADFQKQRELHPLAMTQEQYDTELAGLKQYWSDVYSVTADGQKRLTAQQEDWTNGVMKGLHDFYDQQSNMAAIAEGLTNDFFSDASDNLSEFISGTKSAGDAIKDFINTFEQQITQAISKQLLKQLFDVGGSSGSGAGGGSMGSIFDLFSSDSFSYFASGGSPGPNSISRVNENGPEMLSVGGRDYLMMGDQAGVVKPNRGATSSNGRAPVTQNNHFNFAAPTSLKTQNQVANRTSLLQRQASRLS